MPPFRASWTPQCIVVEFRNRGASGLMLSRPPKSSAAWCQRQSRSRPTGHLDFHSHSDSAQSGRTTTRILDSGQITIGFRTVRTASAFAEHGRGRRSETRAPGLPLRADCRHPSKFGGRRGLRLRSASQQFAFAKGPSVIITAGLGLGRPPAKTRLWPRSAGRP
jgi:hypothetical protein